MNDNANTTAEASAEDKTRSDLLKVAYRKATSRLREERREDFNRLMAEEAKAAGVEWTAPLSPAEKARAEIERLAQEHGLTVAFNPQPAVSEEPHSARIAAGLQQAAEDARASAAEEFFGEEPAAEEDR